MPNRQETARFVLAIDEGTTGCTALVFDSKGDIRGRGYSEFAQYYPQPGWVEHEPEEIWQVTRRVVRAALRHAKLQPADIAAIGITNQRETTVLWDRETGEPIHRAIVWQDRRTASLCEALTQRGATELVRSKTGLVLDPYFSGTKIRWLLDHVRGARKRASRLAFGTIDTWLVWKLTGGRSHVTDYTNASRTLLFDIHARRWDDALLDLLDVPGEILPQAVASSGEIAMTDRRAFGAEVPICGIAGDQQAALYGQTCFKPGLVKNTYGTGCFVLMYTGDRAVRSERGLLTTIACDAKGAPAYATEGAVFIAGAAVQWLRDGLGLIARAGQSEDLARSVDSSLGVYLVPAFVGLGAPYWDPAARGALVGLTRGATKAHVARATLEAIAYQTRDIVTTMVEESGRALSGLRVDGGAAANDFLMQFQADILGTAVDRPKVVETTALGAALLAGRGVGLWRTSAELEAVRQRDRLFRPAMPARKRESLYAGWLKAVSAVRSLGS